MGVFKGLLALTVLESVGIPASLYAAELHAATDAAWEAYVRAADQRMQARLDGAAPFLWIDEESGRSLQVRSGTVLVGPGMGNGAQSVPNGLIHHWIGAGFIPGVTRAAVAQVVHDYARYQQIYRPPIVDSKVLTCGDEQQCFTMRTLNHVLFVTAVFETECANRDFTLDATRWYSVGRSTRVQEVQNYGQADERMLAPGSGNGYLWRLHTITRYEERDGGVYIEIEAIALSRGVPVSLRWLISPVIARLSESSVMASVRQTREAVIAAAKMEPHANPSARTNAAAIGPNPSGASGFQR